MKEIPSPFGRGLGEGLLATQISSSSQVRGTEPRAVATGIKKLSTTTRRAFMRNYSIVR